MSFATRALFRSSKIAAGVGRSDTFNRANGAINALPPSDNGSSWVTAGAFNLPAIATSKVIVGTAAFQDNGAWLAHSSADCTVQSDVVVGGDGVTGLLARVSSDLTFGVVFWYDKGNNEYRAQHRIGGAYTTMGGPSALTLAQGTALQLQIVCAGNSIICKSNGATIFSYSDATNSGVTNHGIFLFASSTGNSGSHDNFSCA